MVGTLVKFEGFSNQASFYSSIPHIKHGCMLLLLTISSIGGQKRIRSLPPIFPCFIAALGGLAVHVDNIDDQLDAAQDETYPIGDLQRFRRRSKPCQSEKVCNKW
jgi:hypothetical protein